MQNLRVVYVNLWRDAVMLGASSENPQYPAESTQDDDTSFVWRSRSGVGTGGGMFLVSTAFRSIDFDQGGAEFTATIALGTYNGTTLAAEIKTRMDAASGGVYTVTYSETTGKFTIYRAAGNFTLRWLSGTNHATEAGTRLGFDVTANDTGAGTYTSDYARFHYPYEYIDVDFGVAKQYDYMAILNHNLTSAAIVTVRGADDAAFTVNVLNNSVPFNGTNMRAFGSAPTKRYVRIIFQDSTNPAGYIQVGTIVLGKYYSFASKVLKDGREDGPTADSETAETDSGNVYLIQRKDSLDTMAFQLRVAGATSAADKAEIILMIKACQTFAAIDFIFDYTLPNTAGNALWARLISADRLPYQHVNYWTWGTEIKASS